MHKEILKLAHIAQKESRHIIGLMSGTSLDGLDIAWCEIKGIGTQSKVTIHAFHTEPYDNTFKKQIKQVFAQQQVDFQHLTLLNEEIALLHASIVQKCLKNWGQTSESIDLIASHGQTVFHAPKRLHQLPDRPNATLQIGDGDHLARQTGIITLSDFRQKHVAAGGEGAPLALYGDYLLFGNTTENRILLNVGGIANFTWLPAPTSNSNIFATDTGPGNTLIDAFAHLLFNVPFDQDGKLAKAGCVDAYLLKQLKAEPFFAQEFPKTTGPELFSIDWVNQLRKSLPKGQAGHNPYNLLATLTALTAETIAEALQLATQHQPTPVFISGGGAHNPALIEMLHSALPNYTIQKTDILGISTDAKEAVLFALLANEAIAATHTNYPKGILPVSMGKISLPS
jgi:anhydro-N-acetylmuramic acid kinase